MLGIAGLIFRGGLQAALAFRRGEAQDSHALAYWCGVWAILAAGSFGVVLEGPMGAIPFWSFLGLGVAYNERNKALIPAARPVAQTVSPVYAPTLPVGAR